MRKTLATLLLLILALLSVTAAVFLSVDGSLARITGWYHFRPGMSLFPQESLDRLDQVSWMRIQDLHDTIECKRAADGSWWIVSPFRDRMSPSAVHALLNFTANARLVDTLPMNHTTRASLREFGVETSPHSITLKMPSGDHSLTTVARYTLGSASPWLADAEDGEHLLPTTYLRTDFYGRDKRIHVVSGNILSIFKNGLEGMRDPHPLNIDPDSLLSLTIRRAESDASAPIVLTRASAQSPWALSSPTLCEADQSQLETLTARLAHLRAVRIDDASAVELPEEPLYTLLCTLDTGETKRLSIYPPFASPTDGQLLCYATVNDRPVVFTLPVEPRVRRRGSYADFVNGIMRLPILPSSVQARIQTGYDTVYIADLSLNLNELRSQHFSNIETKDIDRAFLRSRFSHYPLRLLRIPGDSEGQVDDVWMFSTGGKKYQEADTEVVTAFLNSMSSVPVTGFLHDMLPGENPQRIIAAYGLNNPDYTLILQPRECAARAVLFGVDMPLVRDRAPRTFFMKRYRQAGESFWVGMEQNTHSIYRLSPKLMRLFSFLPQTWKKRNLVHFPISALRSLKLQYQQAPLSLEYDYIGEVWTGRLGDEDITPRLNPHRTNYYVRHLQNIRVKQWLSSDDEEALQALAKPVFTVELNLETIDYSDLESIVLQQKDDETGEVENGSRMETVEKMLTESDDTDQAFRHMALGERKVEKRSVTIDIAPADSFSSTPFFYGRIRETGELFILSFDDAQALDGQLLD